MNSRGCRLSQESRSGELLRAALRRNGLFPLGFPRGDPGFSLFYVQSVTVGEVAFITILV
jgi:hypothetical protein